jgi:hypothetical protein
MVTDQGGIKAIKGRKSSFLKKRSKKLLQFASGLVVLTTDGDAVLKNKSFLVLFFKKEHLSFLLQAGNGVLGAAAA